MTRGHRNRLGSLSKANKVFVRIAEDHAGSSRIKSINAFQCVEQNPFTWTELTSVLLGPMGLGGVPSRT